MSLKKFFYESEVMPLLLEVTIPMEQAGVCLDVPLMQKTLTSISAEIASIEAKIQNCILPYNSIFKTWFLNKDYPEQTRTGKVPVWKKRHGTQEAAFAADYPGAYMFNLQSKHHLKKLFFDTLKLVPLSRTPTGLPQVDEEFLDSIAPQYAWVHDLITYNKLNKIKSTYIERLLEGNENGKFYARFMQHRTVSGRYAGDLQQLPRPIKDSSSVAKYTNSIREFIVPSSGNKLISADYEQLEPSIFAHVSGDAALQAIFNKGTDFYSEVAIRTERLTGYSSDKTAPNYLGKLDPARRQRAKAYALGIAYGMTGYKLQFEIGVSQNEAEQLVQNYLKAFPSLAYFMARSKTAARTEGFVSSQAGRLRRMPRCKEIYSKYGPAIDNSLQLWKDLQDLPDKYEAAKAARKEYSNLCNNAINFQIQSLAASVVNRAAININRRFAAEGVNAKLVMQVHDELVYDCPEAEISLVCNIIKHEMENVMQLSVPLRTTPQVGANFRECK